MVRVWIDEVPWGEAPAAGTKEELWEALNGHLASQGRIYRALEVDGEALEVEAFLQVTGGQELRVTSCPVRELVRESLGQAIRYLPELHKGAERVADLLEEENLREAFPVLSQLSEGTTWVLQVLGRSQVLLALPDGEIGDGELSAVRERLLAVLRDALSSLEGEKFFELAFRLREELVPALVRLGGYVVALNNTAEIVQ